MQIKIFILSGAWNQSELDGTTVIGISTEMAKLINKLADISSNHAASYLSNTYGKLEENISERFYEVMDQAGAWAKFYLTEHFIEI